VSILFQIQSTYLEWVIQRLRPMSYSKSHVILIAFAIDTRDSLENVTIKAGLVVLHCRQSDVIRILVDRGSA